MHPSDAARLHMVDGEAACVTSRVGSVEIPAEITDAIMPGVVSIPHGGDILYLEQGCVLLESTAGPIRMF